MPVLPILPLLSVGSRSDHAWLLEPHCHSLWKMLSFLIELQGVWARTFLAIFMVGSLASASGAPPLCSDKGLSISPRNG